VGRDPERARAEQARVERELKAAFASGLCVSGFDKARASYVLTRKRP
jgi:hypothetical protein